MIAAELQKRRQLNGADIIGLLGSPPPPTLPPSAPPSTLPSPSIPAEDQYSTRLHRRQKFDIVATAAI
jgi:hypothetical protein